MQIGWLELMGIATLSGFGFAAGLSLFKFIVEAIQALLPDPPEQKDETDAWRL